MAKTRVDGIITGLRCLHHNTKELVLDIEQLLKELEELKNG